MKALKVIRVERERVKADAQGGGAGACLCRSCHGFRFGRLLCRSQICGEDSSSNTHSIPRMGLSMSILDQRAWLPSSRMGSLPGSHRPGWAPFLAHIVKDGLPSWLPSSRMSSHPGSNSAFLCIFSSPSWPCTLLQGGAAALSMSTSKQILDPMDIMHSKSMQDCPLRAYK